MTAGPRGPQLLQDVWFLEKLAHFDREVIPERRTHAKGSGAYGTFTVTRDITRYTRARIFSEEGNWDLVGNNTPVFFLRDPLKFPDLNHAVERDPRTNLRSARNNLKTQQGIKNLTDQEAEAVIGKDRESHRRDLYEAIEKGDFPRWDVKIQVVPEADAGKFPFNPFDLTKVWPHGDCPLVDVGVLEPNRNPENYFAEVEQSAFNPAQRQVLFENTARAMGDAPREIKIRHIGSCCRADPAYGEGVAKALGIPLGEVPR